MGVEIPFNFEFNFEYDQVEQITPLIRRVVARNPSPLTFYGTNTYIVGFGEVALIDPGPDLEKHVTAIMEGLKEEVITHILITHYHLDHWPAFKPLINKIGGKTYGYNSRGSKKSGQLTPSETLSFKPGLEANLNETEFTPDVSVSHGDILEGENWSLECVHTPGHHPAHICYYLGDEKTLFTGDHVMGWSTSVISPPSGNMEAYMASLELLLQRDNEVYWPAHGPCIEDTKPYVRAFIAHRKEREEQILESLSRGIDTIQAMVPGMYHNVSKILHPAATRSVLAEIIYLIKQGKIVCDGEVSVNATYGLP